MHLFSPFALIIPALFPVVHAQFNYASLAEEYVELSPRYLLRVEEDNSLVPFPSGRNAEIRFSGVEAGGTEIRMLTTFRVPTFGNYRRCVITFVVPLNTATTPTSQQSSVAGNGIFDVYRIGEVTVGRSCFHNRPLREPAFPVFNVQINGDDTTEVEITGEPIAVQPGERLDFELVATRGVGSTDIIFYQGDGNPTDVGGVGLLCF